MKQRTRTTAPISLVACVVLVDVLRSWYSQKFYQEIDWPCYSRDAQQVLSGEFDYSTYLCEWGRMYYPAMFAWFYAGLYWITSGIDRFNDNLIVIGSLSLVMWASVIAKGLLTLITVSTFSPLMRRRDWWIFLLLPFIEQNVYRAGISRISNDLYLALMFGVLVWSLSKRHFLLTSLSFALAVAFKMNTLLFGPALLFSYLHLLPFWHVVVHFALMGIAQVLLALPFLLTNPYAYITIAFNFGRDFEHRVNMAWGFLGDSIRHDPRFYTLLLFLTIFFIIVTLVLGRRRIVDKNITVPGAQSDSMTWMCLMMLLLSNFVGYTFSRGVHIQFFLWLSFSLPFVLTQGAGLGGVNAVLIHIVFDWCHSWVPSVVRLDSLWQAIVNMDIGALFDVVTTLKSVDTVSTVPLVPMLGKYFNEGLSLFIIPSSFILFSLQCLVLWRSMRRLAV